MLLGGRARTIATAMLVACVSPCLHSLPAAAANAPAAASQLTISPVILTVNAQPGETVVEQVGVQAGGAPLNLSFQHADFGFSRDTYQVRIIEDDADRTSPFSTRGWFSAPPGPYHLRANERRDIPVTIKVPPKTEPGEYLGVAFFRTVPKATGSGTQVLTAARSGPLVFITVGGTGSHPHVSLADTQVPRIVGNGPVHASTRVRNAGHGHVTFSGTVTLHGRGRSWTSKVPEHYSVPGIEREVAAKLGSRHLAPGRYVTDVRLRVEPGGMTLHARATTWVLPTWIWGVAAGALLLLAALVLLAVRVLRPRRAALPDAELDVPDEFPADDDRWHDEE